MGLLFSRPKKTIYLQGSSEPARIYRNTDFKFNQMKGNTDIEKMYQRNNIKNPAPYIIPNKRQSRQQQQRRKAEKQAQKHKQSLEKT